AGQATSHRERLAQQSGRFTRLALRCLGDPSAIAFAVAGRNSSLSQSKSRYSRARLYGRGVCPDRRAVWPAARVPGDSGRPELRAQERQIGPKPKPRGPRSFDDLRPGIRYLAGGIVIAAVGRGRSFRAEPAKFAAG